MGDTYSPVKSTPRRLRIILRVTGHFNKSSLSLPVSMIAKNQLPRSRGCSTDEERGEFRLSGPRDLIFLFTVSPFGGRFFQFLSVPQKLATELVDGTSFGRLASMDLRGVSMTKLYDN